MDEFQLTKSNVAYVLLIIKTPFTCGRLMIKIRLPRKIDYWMDPLNHSWSLGHQRMCRSSMPLLKVVVYIFHVLFSTFSLRHIIQIVVFQILREIAPVVFILTAANMCISLSHRRVWELFAWYQHFCRNGSLFVFITSKWNIIWT